MIPFFVYSGIGLALLVLLWVAWRFTSPRRLRGLAPPPTLEELSAVHCRYFPQVSRALSAEDLGYLKQRASAEVWRRSLAERRKVVKRFLGGLYQDFSRLEQLGRTVAALSPQVNRKLEFERVWLGLKFRALYRIVWLRLLIGSPSLPQLARLTQMVGILSRRIESAMAGLEEASENRLRSSLSA